MTLHDFVNVSVRLKPQPKRRSFQPSLKVISTNPAVLFSVDKQQTYNFDKIFTEESTQEDVYSEIVKPLVEKLKEGYNCTIFAYGQTGTGKTYTMGTNPLEKTPGIISRVLEDLFSCENDEHDYDVHVSFMEIYNEKVFDLLRNNNEAPLPVKGLRVEGLTTEKVFNVYEAKHFLEMGGKNRHTGETKQNMFSSRSHAIFSIYFTAIYGPKQISAKLNLVDLAGSESAKKTGTQGSSFLEGININKGLLCIGQVMTALSGNLSFIPYRQSVITTILQDSLNKNNYISLIACVKTSIEDSTESIQALEFAQRVKKMKNKPEINEVIIRYKHENPLLFEKNVKVFDTPMKRAAETPFRFSAFKKPRTFSVLNNISVPSSIDNSKSVASLSSVSNSEVGTNFSPVIKRYMDKLESTIIDKLQTVIQQSIKRTTRRSTRLSLMKGDKENTPKYSWNQIQHKVSKLVQEEILQHTSKTTRATSSPIEQSELYHAKRVLHYSNSSYKEECEDYEQENISKNNISRKLSICVSPIDIEKSLEEYGDEKIKLSEEAKEKISLIVEGCNLPTHLQTEKKRRSRETSIYISPVDIPILRKNPDTLIFKEPMGPRRSMRLSVKMNSNQGSKHASSRISHIDFTTLERSSDTLVFKKPTLQREVNISNAPNEPRRSMRLSIKTNGNLVSNPELSTTLKPKMSRRGRPPKLNKPCDCGNSSTISSQKKIEYKETKNEDPIHKRTQEVLNIINKGNRRDIQKLPTIGPKTAERILLFRELKGSFKSVKELMDMPGWSASYFNNFVEQNFLTV